MQRVKSKSFIKKIKYWFKDRSNVDYGQVKDNFYIIGHRGACAWKPENTITSFEHALNLGANAFELDISLTKDNNIVLWHDWSPNNVIGKARRMQFEPVTAYYPAYDDGWMKDTTECTLAEIKEHFYYKDKKYDLRSSDQPPSLDEFLQFVIKHNNKIKLIIFDVKAPDDAEAYIPALIEKMTQLLMKYKLQEKVVLMSPHENICEAMWIRNPYLNYTWDKESPMGVVFDWDSCSAVDQANRFGFNFASIGRAVIGQLSPWITYREIVENDLVKAKESDITYIGWTINDESEMLTLIKMGIDGLVIDDPSKLRKAYDVALKSREDNK